MKMRAAKNLTKAKYFTKCLAGWSGWNVETNLLLPATRKRSTQEMVRNALCTESIAPFVKSLPSGPLDHFFCSSLSSCWRKARVAFISLSSTFPRWGRSGPPVLGTGKPRQYWALAWRRTSRSSHPCATPWLAIWSEILSIRSEISLWKVAGLIWNRLVAPLSFGMINGIYGPSRMRMQEDACGQEHVVLQENTLLQDLEWEWRRNHVTLESSWPDLN